MRALAPPVVVGFVIALAACGGGGGGGDGQDDPSDAVTPAVPAALSATVERVLPDGSSPLVPGDGDERLELAAVAAAGGEIVAAGVRHGADGSAQGAVLLRSADGRDWADVELPGDLAAGTITAATAVADAVLVVGDTEAGAPAAARYSDGGAEPVELAFPDPGGGGRPAGVRAVAAAGERVFVAAVGLEGTDDPGSAVAALSVLYSDDAGASWTALTLPEDLRVVDTGAAVIEQGRPGEIDLVLHDGAPVLSVAVPGADGVTTTLWSADPDGADWTALGTAADLFDGQALDLLHSHGDSLLAFTRGGDDATAWRSDDGGAGFSRIETDPWVLGGGGRQSVDAALTLGSGALVVAGVTEGEARNGRRPGQLELWLTPDLATWHRQLDDAALTGSGRQVAVGLVALGEQAVVIGTDQRSPLEDEAEDPQVSLATHGASWIVSVEAADPVEPPVTVAPLDVSGFSGDVTVNALLPVGDGLLALGAVEAGDVSTPAAWTSADGAAWTPVDAPALADLPGEIRAATTTADGGIVAVGDVSGADPDDDDSDRLGVWTSPDGTAWQRVDLTGSEFAGAIAYGVALVGDALVAVGTSEPEGRDYRDAGIWRSADAGATWTAVPTDGAPFRARNVEVLSGIGVREDGAVVAVGHTGDAEDDEGGGFRYSPEPYAVESADGQTWTALPQPFGEVDFGELYAAARLDGGFAALGTSGSTLDLPNVDGPVFGSALAQQADDGWEASERRFRHRPSVRLAVGSSAGTVLVGHWHRLGAGTDPLIAVERDGELVAADRELLAEGDQSAVAAATLGDQVIVLGADSTDEDATVVVGWSVAAR